MKIKNENFRHCRECQVKFKTTRDWMIFCSSVCRSRFNKRYYEICFYCGQRGTHRDHVDPRTFSGKNYFTNVEYVYSCVECNCTLSNNLFTNAYERVDFLIKKYIIKHKLNKSIIQWSDEELDELGFKLKQTIKKQIAKRRKNEDRYLYLRSVYQNLILEEDKKQFNDFVIIDSENN